MRRGPSPTDAEMTGWLRRQLVLLALARAAGPLDSALCQLQPRQCASLARSLNGSHDGGYWWLNSTLAALRFLICYLAARCPLTSDLQY